MNKIVEMSLRLCYKLFKSFCFLWTKNDVTTVDFVHSTILYV